MFLMSGDLTGLCLYMIRERDHILCPIAITQLDSHQFALHRKSHHTENGRLILTITTTPTTTNQKSLSLRNLPYTLQSHIAELEESALFQVPILIDSTKCKQFGQIDFCSCNKNVFTIWGPFINYLMHLGGQDGRNCVTNCHGGGGGLREVLCYTKVFIPSCFLYRARQLASQRPQAEGLQ